MAKTIKNGKSEKGCSKNLDRRKRGNGMKNEINLSLLHGD